jgi:hypothetical protein
MFFEPQRMRKFGTTKSTNTQTSSGGGTAVGGGSGDGHTTGPQQQATPPLITGLNPASGASAGDHVTLTGQYLSAAHVTVDGVPATVLLNTDSSLTITIPTTLTKGPTTIDVTTQGGSRQVAYTVTGTTTQTGAGGGGGLAITGVLPASAAPGAQAAITGSGFTGAKVWLGPSRAQIQAVIKSGTDSALTFIVPHMATGNQPISVVAGGKSATQAFTVDAATGDNAPPPAVIHLTGVVPASAAPGATITITGSGLSGATAAVGTAPATVQSSSDSTLVLTVPNVTAGNQSISVHSVGGLSATQAFTVDPAQEAPLDISSVYPPTAYSGQTITVTGTGMLGVIGALVGGYTAVAQAVSDTQLNITVPDFSAQPAPGITLQDATGFVPFPGFQATMPPANTPPPDTGSGDTSGGGYSDGGGGGGGDTTATPPPVADLTPPPAAPGTIMGVPYWVWLAAVGISYYAFTDYEKKHPKTSAPPAPSPAAPTT